MKATKSKMESYFGHGLRVGLTNVILTFVMWLVGAESYWVNFKDSEDDEKWEMGEDSKLRIKELIGDVQES